MHSSVLLDHWQPTSEKRLLLLRVELQSVFRESSRDKHSRSSLSSPQTLFKSSRSILPPQATPRFTVFNRRNTFESHVRNPSRPLSPISPSYQQITFHRTVIYLYYPIKSLLHIPTSLVYDLFTGLYTFSTKSSILIFVLQQSILY